MPNSGFSWGAKLSDIADAVWTRTVRQLSDAENIKDTISDSVWTRSVRQLSDAENIKDAISDSVWTRSERKLTNLDDDRASKIDNLDATISSRQPDVGLTSTHVGRIDADISSRASASDYTSSRASKLDYLDASISSRQPDAGLTSTHVERLDANISSRATNEGVWNYSTRGLTEAVENVGIIASSTVRAEANTERTTSSISFVKIKEFRVFASGTLRVIWEQCTSNSSYTSFTRIYLNGIAVSDVFEETSTSYQSKSFDLGASSGDYVQIYAKIAHTSQSCYVRNAWLCYAVISGETSSPSITLD